MIASIQVYSMDHALAQNDASEVVQFLSNDELSQDLYPSESQNTSSTKSIHTKRWREKVASRSCLVRAVQRISQEYSISDILSNIDYKENGKPFFRELPIDFSLSHSRGMVAAVAVQKVNHRAIGIDLEVDPRHSIESFARVCTQEEWSEIQSMESPVARKSAFLRRWCAKEAYVKALGKGLGYGFKHLEVRRSPEHALEANNGHSHAEAWTLTDKKQKSHPTHPIYTWEMDSATQDGTICISLAYAILSTSSSPAQDPQSPVLEFLINDGQGLPDFK
ncbi:MAG: 4'-phosphopantetheinyl transferase superfamily protein [Balneolaceae bacterium]|nr:4'-phosphopantetheinyl transferase superfamily protein [Balneolaceae bacterium]